MKTTYTYMRRDVNGMHAAFTIAKYQRFKPGIINDIVQRLDGGQTAKEIEAEYIKDGRELTAGIWYIARFMIVLDKAQQN